MKLSQHIFLDKVDLFDGVQRKALDQKNYICYPFLCGEIIIGYSEITFQRFFFNHIAGLRKVKEFRLLTVEDCMIFT